MPTPRTRLGTRGEVAARGYLEAKGYQVVATNYRCQWGELDIVAQQGCTLVFVEVRSRRSLSYGTPEESISQGKQERLIAASETYLQNHADLPEHWRIDLVSVRIDRRGGIEGISHLENAVLLDR